jgi:hypothetical protein
MSLFLFAALSMASAMQAPASTITPTDRPQIAEAARRLNVPTRALYRAVTAPQAPRRSTREVRYCIERELIVSGRAGQVCHTAQQWARFGIPVARRSV